MSRAITVAIPFTALACASPPTDVAVVPWCAPRGPSVNWFVDRTASATPDFEYAPVDFRGGAIAVFDWNNDGALDLMLGSRGGLLALFQQVGLWQWQDVTAQAGLGARRNIRYVAPADFDNDGDIDLVISSDAGLSMLEFEGQAAGYRQQWLNNNGSTEYILPVDLNRDGLLDLFLGNHDQVDAMRSQNRLLMARGGWQFDDVTDEIGIGTMGLTWSVTAFDANRDGLLDLYVANDTLVADLSGSGAETEVSAYPVDNLYLQTPGHLGFVDQAEMMGLATPRSSMGGNVADLTGDGELDLLIPDFGPLKLFAQMPSNYQERAIMIGLDNSHRRDGDCANTEAGKACLFLSWGTAVADFDLDGWDDVMVLSGASSIPSISPPPPLMFHGNPDSKFNEVDLGLTCQELHGLVAADLDADGDMDVVSAPRDGRLNIWENAQGDGHWLSVRLEGRQSPRQGQGALVTLVYPSGRRVPRVMGAGGVVHSAWPLILHWGIGEQMPSRLEIDWPSGKHQEVLEPATDEVHTLIEPEL